MTQQQLALAINGRERHLSERLVAYREPAGVPVSDAPPVRQETVVVLGLGYVGLPTACGLAARRSSVVGVDVSKARLRAIADGDVDLPEPERELVRDALADGSLRLVEDPSVLGEADAIVVCVPTPVDGDRVPDLSALRGACATAVAHARPGQTIILTSTTFVGTTRDLLVEPLRRRGLTVGKEIHVAFSPERIDPGNHDHVQRETPRIVGGVTPECAARAARVIGDLTDSVYLVGSPEAAELTKLYENIFRAVNLALANEVADVCRAMALDPIEVTIAAGTKPYGFLGSFPGPGVGGHCIPCDPHYLLWQLREQGLGAPVIEQAMHSIEQRPEKVVHRAGQLLAESGREVAGARVLLAGVSYKAGVRDLRESPSLPIITELHRMGADVRYHDPLIDEVELPDGSRLRSEPAPRGQDWDLVVVHTVHPGFDYGWAGDCPRVLDATYQFDLAPHRQVV
ncbi:nucleotide sugar dehydrogenase [Saccharopolyspora sp. HNM0986]|uniref:nucleotide sugar dehydrogenase n=1 Tax=Saccharopolyspora galaxeae TaxID=2781241 RepID=UPI00190A14E8|nr:nucleotide sugar dehydrogenase [Saccharopolyspora sp. HNM0986]MBK0866717.1 nucleotide sugar dehydrogenase [Saccharopolyspora sp. HNM0986]